MQQQAEHDEDLVPDESRGPYFPYNRRERYPKRLKVDFRRLPRKTLLTYTAHHDLHVRPDITHEELAIAAARHFAAWRVNEESIMRSFCAGLRAATLGNGRGLGDDEVAAAARKRRRYGSLDIVPPSPEQMRGGNSLYALSATAVDSTPPPHRSRGWEGGEGSASTVGDRGVGSGSGVNAEYGRDYDERSDSRNVSQMRVTPPAVQKPIPRASGRGSEGGQDSPNFVTGEQVAAYMARDGEEEDNEVTPRAWILARVVRERTSGMVELCDEDDASHVFRLSPIDVRHLVDNSDELQKYDKVKAVFPDTTMFYGATVAKESARMEGNTKVVVVYFEDDEDANGKTRYRRVPVEHVMLDDNHRRPNKGGGALSGSGGGRTAGQTTSGSQRSGGPRPRAASIASSRARGSGGRGALVARASGGESIGLGGGRSGGKEQGKKGGSTTYADMIAHALGKVEGGRGAFSQICNIIERDFHDGLNWKLESDVRKTPVWKSSVRKILFSNNRFHHAGTSSEHGHIFTLARLKK